MDGNGRSQGGLHGPFRGDEPASFGDAGTSWLANEAYEEQVNEALRRWIDGMEKAIARAGRG